MEIRILGPLEVHDADGPMRLGGPQQRALLALLVIQRGAVVSTDRLIDELWPEHPPPTAVKTVQMYVSQLRRVLGNGALTTCGRGYRLEVASAAIDARRFEDAVAEASVEQQPDRAVELLRDAISLWRGPALADVAGSPLAQAEISRLEELRLVAIEARLERELELRRPRIWSRSCRRWSRRIRSGSACARCRCSPSTARAVRRMRSTSTATPGCGSIGDLGLEPTRELRELEAAILRQDRALDPPTRAARSRPARRASARRLLVVGGGLVAVAAAAAMVVSSGAGSKPSLATVNPDSVAVIEPSDGRIVGSVPVGAEPGAMALAGGRLWVTNGGDRTLTAVDARSRRVCGPSG